MNIEDIKELAKYLFVVFTMFVCGSLFYNHTHQFFGCIHNTKYFDYWSCGVIHIICSIFFALFSTCLIGYIFAKPNNK